MNWFGFWLCLATLFIIGLGFVWVIRGERYFGHLWWPYVMGAGVLCILGLIVHFKQLGIGLAWRIWRIPHLGLHRVEGASRAR